MGLKIKLEWQDGEPRASTPRGYHLLARFLEGEIQGSLRHGFELLDIMDDLVGRRRSVYSETGNAMTIYVTSVRATLQSEVSDESLNLDTADLRAALAGWLVLLAKGAS